MTKDKMDRLAWLRKTHEDADLDLMREMLMVFAEELMGAEADAVCGAGFRERSAERVNRRRAERALVAVIAGRCVRGVSARRVDGLVRALGIEGISKPQVSRLATALGGEAAAFRSRPLGGGSYPCLRVDALAIRVREGGRVVKAACAAATAEDAGGRRGIVGLDTFTEETGAAWTAFLRDLAARGLSGVRLVVSDSRKGLVSAIRPARTGGWTARRAFPRRGDHARGDRSRHHGVLGLPGRPLASDLVQQPAGTPEPRDPAQE